MSLYGKCAIFCGKDGTGKSTQNEIILKPFGDNIVALDWHGDRARNNRPGLNFPGQKVKEFVEYISNPELTNIAILLDEAENYFARERYNPFGIDRVKINWALSAKGPHHRNLFLIFNYHALKQIPDEIKHFYDWFWLYEQESNFNAIKDIFSGDKIFDAYQYYETLYNSPGEKLKFNRNGHIDLVKPPFVFSRKTEIPKLQPA